MAKTAEEKANEFCSRFTGMDKDFARHVAILLKEQDRDTRHVCAEAIKECRRTVSMCATAKECHAYNAGIGDAAVACMNVKAV
jgi:hypothetical protein